MAKPHPSIHARLQGLSSHLRAGSELAAIEAEVTKEVWEELEKAREELEGELNSLTTQIEIDRVIKLLTEIERQQAQLEIAINDLFFDALSEAWHEGEERVHGVAEKYGLEITSKPFISRNFLEVAVRTLPDLIKGITDEWKGDIGRILRRAALGRLTPLEVMQQIGKLPPYMKFNYRTGKFEPLTQAELRRAMAAKGPYAKLFRRIEATARTEIGRIAQTANFLTMQEVAKDDPRWMKEWSAVLDSRTRPDHVALSGERVPVNEAFHISGEALRYPHDPAASASETINCRCTILPWHPAFEDHEAHNEVPDSFGRTTFRDVGGLLKNEVVSGVEKAVVEDIVPGI